MRFIEQNAGEIRRVTWVGLILNIILAALKISIGLAFFSQSLVADGVHSISDMATDLAVIIGVGIWNQPPDEKHPYGHGALESFISAIIGISLALVAVGLIWDAVKGINDPHKVLPGWPALVVALVSIAMKEWLYRWTVKIGRRLHSSALVSNAWHHRSDALSSVPVAAAVIGGFIFPTWFFLDHLAAAMVSIMLLKASWDITYPWLREVCEVGAGREYERVILEAAKEVDGVDDIHAIRTRKLGGSVFADMHILVQPTLTVRQGHEIAKRVRDHIMEKNERIVDILIHIEPNDPEQR